jgi:hypothetical protein
MAISAQDGGGLVAPVNARVNISVVAGVVAPPVFQQSQYHFTVSEDSMRGVLVGVVQASVKIGGWTLIYTHTDPHTHTWVRAQTHAHAHTQSYAKHYWSHTYTYSNCVGVMKCCSDLAVHGDSLTCSPRRLKTQNSPR